MSYSPPKDATETDVGRIVGVSLEERLLAIGGTSVEKPMGISTAARERLKTFGREWSTEGRTVVAGWPYACLVNAVPRWLNGEGDLVRGAALREADGVWWISHWIGRPDGTVLDSLPGHIAYFGLVLDDAEIDDAAGDLVDAYALALGGHTSSLDLISKGRSQWAAR